MSKQDLTKGERQVRQEGPAGEPWETSRVRQREICAKRDLPIGVFDSGVGGISVLRQLLRILPEETFYYLGDEANAPYGTKQPDEIRRLTLHHVETMAQQGIKALMIACNTATSAAIGAVRLAYPQMPVVGIEPALKPAVMVKDHPTVVVMATPGTVHGRKYRELMERFASQAHIIPLGCPGLMEYVERGELSGSSLERYLSDLFHPYVKERDKENVGIDAIVLGCTHYPFIRKAIREVVGSQPVILDGSEGCARQLKRQLIAYDLCRSVSAQPSDIRIRDTRKENSERVTWHMTLPGKEGLCLRLLREQI